MIFFPIQIILSLAGTLVSQVNSRVLYSSSILKEIRPEYSLEGLILKLKLQYFGHLMQRTDSVEKTLMLGKDWQWEEKGMAEEGMAEDEMAGWHHGLDGRESEWTPGVGDGQGGLVCCDSWGRKESDTTERLNWTELNWTFLNGDSFTFVFSLFE